MKKGLSLFLILVFVFTVLTSVPVTVSATNTDDLTFELNETGTMYKVIGCNYEVSGTLVIPSLHNGLPVTQIASLQSGSITSITIPSSITGIKSNAFISTSLEDINITDIASWCGIYFGGNSSSVHGTATNPLEVAHNLYLNNELVTNLIIPGAVTKISNDAFCGCDSIENVTISNGVETIGDCVFHNCSSLTNVTISDSVTKIGGAAFENCEKLKEIIIPESVTSIGFMAFYGCGLTSVTIPKSVVEIESRAFGYKYDSWLNKSVKIDGFKIYGYKGSAAEKYANNNGFEFVKLECKKHTASSWITDKKATVNTAGEKHKECTGCGVILETATIAQLKCSKPTLKTISNTSSGIKITWGKVSGADKYYVYRKTSSGSYSRIGSTTKTYYTDKTAKSGKKYYYIVKAINEAGASSSSNSLSKYYLADTTLSTPKSTKSGITLKWKKVTGADGYQVYRKTGSGSYSKIATVKGNSKVNYTDNKAKKGKTYTYKIKAYKSKTTSAYSNAKKIKDKY